MSNSIRLAGEATVAFVGGNKVISRTTPQTTISSLLKSSNPPFPTQENGIYVFVTSQDAVDDSGFCQTFCAYHSGFYISSMLKTVNFIYVPNTANCMGGCAALASGTANGNPAVDAMVNVMSHELVETSTDPLVYNAGFKWAGWYEDATGNEAGDLCAWNFGPFNGNSNVQLGSYQFLLQNIWVNRDSGYCSLHYP
jgi:hypothetical protein